MNKKFSKLPGEADKMVYVRAIEISDLPEDIQIEVAGATQVFAVHSSKGERLALVRDKELAFFLARQNDLAPMSVH
jgi:hypothetical protein